MLRIKFFENPKLGAPELEIAGENTLEIADKYLLQTAAVGHYKSNWGRMNRTMMILKLPKWGIIKNKAMLSSAFFCDSLVKNGLAEWIEFSEEEFNPKNAVAKIRIRNGTKITEESLRKRSESKKANYAAKPEEEKARIRANIRAGLLKGRAAAREEKLRARRIARGDLPASQAEIPDWFEPDLFK